MNRNVTANQLGQLRKALAQLPVTPPPNKHPLLWKAQREGLESLAKELELELASQDSLADQIVKRWQQEFSEEQWSAPSESQMQMMAQWALEEIEDETT